MEETQQNPTIKTMKSTGELVEKFELKTMIKKAQHDFFWKETE